MSIYRIVVDSERCIGCHACEVHCKTNKNLKTKLCNILSSNTKVLEDKPVQKFLFVSCFHCGQPPCVDVCPTGAIQKRKKDGIVFIDRDLCIGCKNCIDACPWGIPQYDLETGTVIKCDLCMERLDQGLLPACVTKCTTHALKLVSVQELSELKKEKNLRKEIL